ncbi:MAG: L,D-transpeptidase [Rhizobiaceae bacterium]|nr:L,D-transpeptidase [Rhizobiaceae bacterium]
MVKRLSPDAIPLLSTALVAAAAGLFFATSAFAGKVVAFKSDVARGSIVVRTNERQLYLVIGGERAIRYPVGVGRAGRQWVGTSLIKGKYLSPNWAPPPAIRRDRPDLPDIIAGGAPNNPMGVAALTLSGGNYAIHGTNAPNSIGRFVSYGCIRMSNEDITDLYKRIRVGTRVVVER